MSFNIASAIDSVLVVDDKFEDVKELIEELSKKSIQAEYINPAKIEDIEVKCGNTLLVLDFELIEGAKHKDNIAEIRKVLSKITNNLNVYGIAFWSKHCEDDFDDNPTKKLFDEMKARIDSDIADKSLVNPPFYYVTIMDKLSYINGTHHWSDFFDHFKSSLESNKIATYYFRWTYLMKEVVYDTFGNINAILADYQYMDREQIFAFLLHQLSYAHIGYKESDKEKLANHSFRAVAGLFDDAIKEKSAFIKNCKILESYSDDFNAKNINGTDVRVKVEKGKIENDSTLIKTIGRLNSVYAFDFKADYAKDRYLPGNIYLQPDDFPSRLDEVFKDEIKILFEITPPCDFAQGTCNVPKFLEGVLCKPSIGKNRDKDKFYNFVNPVVYKEEPYHFILDFNTMYIGIISTADTHFICRANDGLFADVLQKYSSHISRLGVSFINNIKY